METMVMDIPRAYTAFAEWAACTGFFLALGDRKKSKKNLLFCLAFLIVQTIFFVLTDDVGIGLWIPCMAAAVLMMFGFLRLTLDIELCGVVFLCAKSFLAAEFAASFEWQIHVHLFYESDAVYGPVQILTALLIYSLVFLTLYRVEQWRNIEENLGNISWKDGTFAVLIALISFAVSNLNFLIAPAPYEAASQNYIFMIRTLVDLCGIAVMFIQQSRLQEIFTEKELAACRVALKSQYEQYRNYQDSFEVINRKYHDIKHQIAGLRAETDSGRRNVWLNELEQELDLLRDVGHTGNQVLDGILAAKMGYCRKNHIKITCVADGDILKGIHVTDICTIFGNALDNAVECVSLLEDEKKLIHFSVTKEKNFIFIRVENYCDRELETGKDGLPVTTKPDKKEHGYGMKSIRMSVEKYHGSMSYTLKDHWFELKILIPLTA